LADSEDKDKVIATIEDVKAAVQSIAEFTDRCLIVFDEDDALSSLKGLARFPAAVIQYEGMRAVSESEKSSNKTGASTELIVSIMVINQSNALVKSDTKIPTIKLLTLLRRQMLGRKTPGGHQWAFVVEAAAKSKDNMVFWIQRWKCPLILQMN
jgi:hypothetical protein